MHTVTVMIGACGHRIACIIMHHASKQMFSYVAYRIYLRKENCVTVLTKCMENEITVFHLLWCQLSVSLLTIIFSPVSY